MGDISFWMLDSEDFFPDPFNHDDDEYRSYRQSYHARCKYCGSLEVTWSKIDGKWRLYTRGQPHICKQYRKP